MKSIFISLILLANINYAKSESEIKFTEKQSDSVELIDAQSLDTPKITINEIKEYLKSIDHDSTCLDEYLKRRNQLLTKLAFTPLMATLETIGAVYIGGTAGVLIAQARSGGTEAGWDALGYAIGGAMIGGAISVTAAVTNTAITGIDLYDIDLVAKSLGELYLNKEKNKSEKLYEKYQKSTSNPMAQDVFFEELLNADSNGSLCDGSMIKQPRLHFGAKLKYKVSRTRELFNFLNK